MAESISGGCLCGNIRYEIRQDIQNIITCHCTHCQKASGSGMSHNTPVPKSMLHLVSGQPKVFADTAASGNTLFRAFCPDCGSPIYSQRELVPDMLIVKVGSLDNSNAMKVVMNVWTNSARPWAHIDPATEQYPENRPIKT